MFAAAQAAAAAASSLAAVRLLDLEIPEDFAVGFDKIAAVDETASEALLVVVAAAVALVAAAAAAQAAAAQAVALTPGAGVASSENYFSFALKVLDD